MYYRSTLRRAFPRRDWTHSVGPRTAADRRCSRLPRGPSGVRIDRPPPLAGLANERSGPIAPGAGAVGSRDHGRRSPSTAADRSAVGSTRPERPRTPIGPALDGPSIPGSRRPRPSGSGSLTRPGGDRPRVGDDRRQESNLFYLLSSSGAAPRIRTPTGGVPVERGHRTPPPLQDTSGVSPILPPPGFGDGGSPGLQDLLLDRCL